MLPFSDLCDKSRPTQDFGDNDQHPGWGLPSLPTWPGSLSSHSVCASAEPCRLLPRGLCTSHPLRSDLSSSFLPPWSLPYPGLGPLMFLHGVVSLWASLSELSVSLLICVYDCDALINNGYHHSTVCFTKAGSKGLFFWVSNTWPDT